MDVDNAISNVTTDTGGTLEAPFTVTGPEAPAPETPPADAKTEPSTTSTESEPTPKEGEPEDSPKEPEKKPDSKEQEDLKKAGEASRNDANKVLTEKGLNMAEFEQEYTVNGGLSEESLAKLEKAGIPRTMVQAYIDGQNALVTHFVNEVQAIAGGEQGYQDVVNWAKENLSEEEKNAYDKVMFSGDKELIKLAVAGLVAQYREVEGVEPEIHIHGKAPASRSSRVSGYKNVSEMKAAMRDPRYGKDPDYTREVEMKTMKASFM